MRGVNCLYNFVTLIFVTLTFIVLAVVLASAGGMMEPPLLAVKETVIVPTLYGAGVTPGALLPTFTPSTTPIPTETPTLTPSMTPTPSATNTATGTATHTGTPMPTATFTRTPTLTPIPPTATATATLTFTPSYTPTFTPSPTGPSPTPTPTLSPYPFKVQEGTPLLRENYANGAGCNWQGMAGQVVKETGEAVVGVNVRVTGDGISELFTITGTNTVYGPSGWEVAVDNKPNAGRYRLELWAAGVQVSPTIEITFPSTCQGNLALINFIQTRPLQ